MSTDSLSVRYHVSKEKSQSSWTFTKQNWWNQCFLLFWSLGSGYGIVFAVQSFTRSGLEKSFYTVNVYLNDGKKDFGGGRTCFFNRTKSGDWKMSVGVVAKPGLALIFNQYPEQIKHDGELVDHGVKYLMRTDVMYRTNEEEMYGK